MLVEELGAYRRAIETLLAQPRQVLRDRRIRELLALAYYQNGAHPEARAIFDSLYPTELGSPSFINRSISDMKRSNSDGFQFPDFRQAGAHHSTLATFAYGKGLE